ncbi:MAG: NAD-dependent protein deacylase [Methanobacteriaceae archaeon]
MANLKEILDNSNNIVFFGGAGVSTESGIPDFRGTAGIYNTKKKYGVSPETILSHSYFIDNTELFYDFYKNNMIFNSAEPNNAHIAISTLEKQGKLKAVITQNIDGLHQKAGSQNVLELHGSIHRNYCMNCNKFYSLDDIIKDLATNNTPNCECGGLIKPDVVLYEEALDTSVMNKATSYIANCDVLIIGGTSLVVNPAASLVQYYNGNKLILINKSETNYDDFADLVIRNPIGEVLKEFINK